MRVGPEVGRGGAEPRSLEIKRPRVIKLAYFGGYSNREIAGEVGLAEWTVQGRLRGALSALAPLPPLPVKVNPPQLAAAGVDHDAVHRGHGVVAGGDEAGEDRIVAHRISGKVAPARGRGVDDERRRVMVEV